MGVICLNPTYKILKKPQARRERFDTRPDRNGRTTSKLLPEAAAACQHLCTCLASTHPHSIAAKKWSHKIHARIRRLATADYVHDRRRPCAQCMSHLRLSCTIVAEAIVACRISDITTQGWRKNKPNSSCLHYCSLSTIESNLRLLYSSIVGDALAGPTLRKTCCDLRYLVVCR